MATYVKDLIERVVVTFAEALLAFIGIDSVTTMVTAQTGLGSVNWGLGLSIAGLAAAVALLKAIIAKFVGHQNSASLVPSVGGPEPDPLLGTVPPQGGPVL